jgi:hypothetical protein
LARLLNRSGCGLLGVFENSLFVPFLPPVIEPVEMNRTFIRYPISISFKSRVCLSGEKP